LAGEAAADDVNGNSICGETFGGEFSDIGIAGHPGPVLRQDAPGEWVDFAEGDGSEAAGPL
jgi:hypothetical protein